MKKLMFVLGLGLIIGMANVNKSEAQVRVNINIDLQPAWGPAGYDYAEYYFIPEINVYYDVINELFYYLDRGRWLSSMFLPIAYSSYDFYSLYKVVLNDILHPWRYNDRHRRLYARYCHDYRQVPIFYTHGDRYNRARRNYHAWVEPRYMPRDNGRPSSRNFYDNVHNGRIDNYNLRSSNGRAAANNRSKGDVGRSSSSVNTRSAAGARNNGKATMDTRNSTRSRNNKSDAGARSYSGNSRNDNGRSNGNPSVGTRSGDSRRSDSKANVGTRSNSDNRGKGDSRHSSSSSRSSDSRRSSSRSNGR